MCPLYVRTRSAPRLLYSFTDLWGGFGEAEEGRSVNDSVSASVERCNTLSKSIYMVVEKNDLPNSFGDCLAGFSDGLGPASSISLQFRFPCFHMTLVGSNYEPKNKKYSHDPGKKNPHDPSR